MRKMANIALATAFAAVAAAESGAFVGISLGYSKASAKITNNSVTSNASYEGGQLTENRPWVVNPDNNATWIQGDPIYGVSEITAQLTREFLQSSDSHDTKGEMSVGILAGYRWFINPNFAVRGYGEFDYQPAKIKGDLPGSNKMNYLNFILGADALGYFNRSDSLQFAAFAGLGAAYSRYDLKLDFLDTKDFDSFGLVANIGLHADIAQNHGVELGARFFTNKAKGDSTIFNSSSNSVSLLKYDIELKQKPLVFLRYMYQF